ncbi:DUF262 domain-containing protein [Agrobacterium tumefaciens]|uniref:DUF262 domain-containing protein n=1 Tax=Agrobacterium tumefaciens TaxID=358 RepID=A0A546XRY3_AGRTU|nr:DUF262 domain-containing protein [Agrobacterium tumefaciens]TRB03502.1 DUF262 domain-containing protein [Agrobacterium tumefaciens]
MLPDEENESLPLDQQEGYEDLDLNADWFVGPTLWSTDWTTETVVSQLRRGNINLNPRYQRRNAWDTKRKSYFIESLILGLPVPQIILAEEKGKKGSFVVIDGKQRLLTLRQFLAKSDDVEFPQLKLTGLDDRAELNGLTYEALQDDLRFRDELNNFENQTVRTVVIRGWKSEKYLYSVFLRINTGSVQLSPQELRQALHPGEFSNFIDDFSYESIPLKRAMKLREPDFRMRDVELVLRYFAYRNFASRYSGDLKKFLDETTEIFNLEWSKSVAMLMEQGKSLEEALTSVRTIFGERDELRKWNGKTFERRINRAVFDIMAYYFSIPEIADASIAKSAQIKAEFQNLCEHNREFVASIESTTKSIDANRQRFGIWASALSAITGLDVRSPIA